MDVPIGNADPEVNPEVCTILTPAQLSFADGAGQVTIAEHKPGLLLVVMLVGHVIKVGAWLSITVTVNVQVEVFPLASVAVNVFVVTPTG